MNRGAGKPDEKEDEMEKVKKVLFIDDDPDFFEACSTALSARKYQVLAGDKTQIEEMMKDEPDIVVLGTMTPARHAFKLAQWIKGHLAYRNIPLLIIDAIPAERETRGWRAEDAIHVEAEGYVSKPIEPAVLASRIQGLLEGFSQKITVLIVDDHAIVRDGIRSLLSLHDDISVVGEAVNGQEAIEKTKELQPDIVLMDIRMPVMNGLDATRRIVKAYPQTKVLILTQYDETENMIVARQVGACGFIPKKAASTELICGIKAVASGECCPTAFAYVAANWPRESKLPGWLEKFIYGSR